MISTLPVIPVAAHVNLIPVVPTKNGAAGVAANATLLTVPVCV